MSSNDFEAFVAFMQDYAPDFTKGLPDVRVDFDRMTGALEPPSDCTRSTNTLGGVPVIELVANGAGADAPVLLYLHGGGFVVGSAGGYAGIAGHLAQAIGGRAVVVDYRLAPETVFPGAAEDAFAAYEALLGEGVPASRIVVIGDSAGGGLALSTLMRLRDAGQALPAAAVLISPWLDLTQSGETMVSHADRDQALSRETLNGMAGAYLGGHPADDPLVSPLFGDLTGLPPVQLQIGTAEVLLDDSLRFATSAAKADLVTDLRVWPGMVHDWPLHAQILSDGRQAIAEAGSFLTRFL